MKQTHLWRYFLSECCEINPSYYKFLTPQNSFRIWASKMKQNIVYFLHLKIHFYLSNPNDFFFEQGDKRKGRERKILRNPSTKKINVTAVFVDWKVGKLTIPQSYWSTPFLPHVSFFNVLKKKFIVYVKFCLFEIICGVKIFFHT